MKKESPIRRILVSSGLYRFSVWDNLTDKGG
jgi:hypothetical protein